MYTRCMSKETQSDREHQLIAKYGIDLEAYDRMWHAQFGLCAICQFPETKTKYGVTKRLAVDHNHETGEVRALLCSRCNMGLGLFSDNSETLEAALDYLKAYGC